MKKIYMVRDWLHRPIRAYEDPAEALSDMYDDCFERTYNSFHCENCYIDKDNNFFNTDYAIKMSGPEKVIKSIWDSFNDHHITEIDLLED